MNYQPDPLLHRIRNIADALAHVMAAIECLESGAPVRGKLSEIAAVIRRDLHGLEQERADELDDDDDR